MLVISIMTSPFSRGKIEVEAGAKNSKTGIFLVSTP